MTSQLLNYICCPITKQNFILHPISYTTKQYNNEAVQIIENGILETNAGTFYPIVNGIPRLSVESVYDYTAFLKQHLIDFDKRIKTLETNYGEVLKGAATKNRRTKRSFAYEWSHFDYNSDKVWDADDTAMLSRFLKETNEDISSIKGKLIFDAGCGNGKLNRLIAEQGGVILGMDFSQSIERAFELNTNPNALFIQGDVQFPPIQFNAFDIVHCSGVLICTNNTELSFSCLTPLVKIGGKLSVWLYQPRKNTIHQLFNFLREYTSKLPFGLQKFIYSFIIYPLSFVVKRAKGNQQTKHEMMIDVLDWFSPEFRWEHTHNEATSWFAKRNFNAVKVTTNEVFGFNIIGVKQ
jgi:SAM-dependent methyltransferase